jgi:hypothetical protein
MWWWWGVVVRHRVSSLGRKCERVETFIKERTKFRAGTKVNSGDRNGAVWRIQNRKINLAPFLCFGRGWKNVRHRPVYLIMIFRRKRNNINFVNQQLSTAEKSFSIFKNSCTRQFCLLWVNRYPGYYEYYYMYYEEKGTNWKFSFFQRGAVIWYSDSTDTTLIDRGMKLGITKSARSRGI